MINSNIRIQLPVCSEQEALGTDPLPSTTVIDSKDHITA